MPFENHLFAKNSTRNPWQIFLMDEGEMHFSTLVFNYI
jgi:hypothetical protein